MLKRCCFLGAGLAVTLLAPSWGWAQQESRQAYRFVSEWTVPEPQVADHLAYLEKNARPVFERMAKGDTIFDWGIFTTVVYNDNGVSHGYWFETYGLAPIEKVRAELANLPGRSVLNAGVKHHDYFLRTLLRRSRSASGTNGYVYFNSTLLQPGKQGQWREWWEKNQKPMYDDFLAKGLVTMYEIDTGQVHTMDPNTVYLVYVTPAADSEEKLEAAFGARTAKRSAEESRTIGDALAAVVVAGSHRDYLGRATSYAQK